MVCRVLIFQFTLFCIGCGAVDQARDTTDAYGDALSYVGDHVNDYSQRQADEWETYQKEKEEQSSKPIVIRLPQIVIVTPTPLPTELPDGYEVPDL